MQGLCARSQRQKGIAWRLKHDERVDALETNDGLCGKHGLSTET